MGVRQQYYDDTNPQLAADEIGLRFSLDGHDYEIDLAQPNAEKLRAAVGPYIEAGRRSGKGTNVVSIGRTARRSTPAKTDREQLDAMREWGRKHGFKVSDRGRVSAALQEAYHNRDETTGKPAANETAPRVDDSPAPSATGVEIRYAASDEEYRTKLRAWAEFEGYRVSARGIGVAPPVIKKFQKETGWHPPQNAKAG